MEYISLRNWGKNLDLHKGDIVFISSDVRKMLLYSIRNKDTKDLNEFIDGIIEEIGEEGTLIFPAYNWGFCKGEEFDYCKTVSCTGSLSSIALKRKDFKRTKHPIYSFAVYGKYQDYLCSLENKSSFGNDSPFAFFRKMKVRNLLIDVSLIFVYIYLSSFDG